MSKDKNVLALIPARGGSKSIPKKNIMDLGGFPLISYSIAAAKLSKHISRIIVSTDSEEIADVARAYGAEVPFMRPAELATDTAVDFGVVKHALDWLKGNEGYEPEYIVFLRPTTPLRDPEFVDKGIEFLLSRPEASSLRSAHELRESPHKMFKKEGNYFVGLFEQDSEHSNLPRQAFPAVYQPDGYVDVWKTETIRTHGVLQGEKMLGFVVPDAGELDNPQDLDFLQFYVEQKNYAIVDYLTKHYSS